MPKLETLQAGRGVAALAVVVHHAFTASKSAGEKVPAFLNYGFLGVDFFFVLSGFIIAMSAPGKSVRDYAWHRFRRVFLPYWPIGISIALLYFFLPGLSASGRSWAWLPTVTLLPMEANTALSVAWTLQHEVMFYTVFGLAWFSGRLWFGMSLWAVAIALGIVFRSELRLVDPINLEFMMGMAAHAAYRRGLGHPLWLLAALLPVGAWLALGSTAAWSPLLGLALAIAIPALLRLEHGGLGVPPALTFLGAASYSLYLAHTPAISLAARVAPGAVFFTSLACGVVAGLAYYLLVERTVLNATPKDWDRPSAKEDGEGPEKTPYPE